MAPKKFYTDVTLVAREDRSNEFTVTLDGRGAKTPGRHPLSATKALAEEIAKEWRSQDEEIDLAAMPLTRLQSFLLDGGERARGEWSDPIITYAGSDLLCYRSPEPALAKRQAEEWQPVLDSLAARFGVAFVVTEGVMAVKQPEPLTAAVTAFVQELPLADLFAGKLMTEILGSAGLALAILMDDLAPEEAFAISRLDERYQTEQWGEDAEAAAREAAIRAEFDEIVKFRRLSMSG